MPDDIGDGLLREILKATANYLRALTCVSPQKPAQIHKNFTKMSIFVAEMQTVMPVDTNFLICAVLKINTVFQFSNISFHSHNKAFSISGKILVWKL